MSSSIFASEMLHYNYSELNTSGFPAFSVIRCRGIIARFALFCLFLFCFNRGTSLLAGPWSADRAGHNAVGLYSSPVFGASDQQTGLVTMQLVYTVPLFLVPPISRLGWSQCSWFIQFPYFWCLRSADRAGHNAVGLYSSAIFWRFQSAEIIIFGTIQRFSASV